jgi:hypothetical protein
MALSSNVADILDSTPRRRVEFDLSRIDIGKLTLLELLDAADNADIPLDELRESLLNESLQAKLVYALAWVIMRRVEPTLTFEDACGFDIIVTGEGTTSNKTKARAKATVAVAQLAHVSAREAEQMTVSEIEAVTDLQERRNRAARRRK